MQSLSLSASGFSSGSKIMRRSGDVSTRRPCFQPIGFLNCRASLKSKVRSTRGCRSKLKVNTIGAVQLISVERRSSD